MNDANNPPGTHIKKPSLTRAALTAPAALLAHLAQLARSDKK